MKFRVIACGVFEPYINAIAAESEHEIVPTVLDAGLHSQPNDLRTMVQVQIDETSRAGGFDAPDKPLQKRRARETVCPMDADQGWSSWCCANGRWG